MNRSDALAPGTHSERSARELLELRAQLLAQPQQTLQLDTSKPLLLFARSGAEYAIDTRYVLQVLAVTAHTELPFVPPFNLGLTAARGELLPLFDLACLLGEPARSGTPRLMLLCGRLRPELALAVDEALDLVASGELLPPPSGGSRLIAGVSSHGFTVIDGGELLSDPRLSIESAQQENLP
jgi:chemotaxis signal transduction protein